MSKILMAFMLFSSIIFAAHAEENKNADTNGPKTLSAKLSNFNGYTISDTKLITGFYESDGSFNKEFSGCKKGMVIKFSDEKTLTCDNDLRGTYGKDVIGVILTKIISYQGKDISTIKMVVKDDVFDMQTTVQKPAKK